MASFEEGDNYEDVARIQAALGVKADGKFGRSTLAAVKAWQKANGEEPNGMVGPDMLLAVGLTDLVLLEKGDEGALVRRVQDLVGVEKDGEYGDRTMKAVRSWQKANGLKADGVAGPQTLERMGLLGDDAQPASPAPPEPAPASTRAPKAEKPASGGWWPWSRTSASTPAPSTPVPSTPATPSAPTTSGRANRPAIASWVYQISDVDADGIAAVPADLAVVDYARDGDDETAFTRADVARMKTRPDGGTKLVVCYMSIGEAEDYRYYWQDAWKKKARRPAWLDDLNPDWEGNYKVRYWDPDWQRHILGSPDAYLDKILAAGFDGVYLDIIDAFEYWRDVKKERASAAEDMIAFVAKIATYARQRNPNFLIIPQNGEALLENAAYRAIISIQAKEDIFYGADGDGKANDKTAVKECLGYLAYARDEGIPVIAIEYLDEKGQRSDARRRLSDSGCVPYFGPRDLASISKDLFA